jgi:hypothetical protein
VEPGRLDLRLGGALTYGVSQHLATCPDLGPACGGPTPPTPYYHHVDLTASDISLDVAYGVLPWLALEARFAYRVVHTHPTYFEQDGSPKLVPDDIHHHEETIAGPGDPWLVARFAGSFGKLVTAARAGFSVPVAGTVPNPYRLAEQGYWHEHTQLGTGTFVPIAGLGLAYDTGPVALSLSALGLFSLYADNQGYRAPSRYFVGLRAAVPLLSRKLTPFATADLAHETDEIWDGVAGQEGGVRRTDVLVGAGLLWEFVPAWTLELSGRGRVARLADGPGFDSPGLLQLALSTHVDKLDR